MAISPSISLPVVVVVVPPAAVEALLLLLPAKREGSAVATTLVLLLLTLAAFTELLAMATTKGDLLLQSFFPLSPSLALSLCRCFSLSLSSSLL